MKNNYFLYSQNNYNLSTRLYLIQGGKELFNLLLEKYPIELVNKIIGFYLTDLKDLVLQNQLLHHHQKMRG